MKKFFSILNNNPPSGGTVSLSVISEKQLGQSCLFSDGQVVYSTCDCVDWLKAAEELRPFGSTGVFKTQQGEIFCEVLEGASNLVICGAGHVSMPIIKIAKLLNFTVTVIDDRPSFTSNALAAGADHAICDSFSNALAQLPDHSNCFYIVVTRGHRYDRECIKNILERPKKYIGVMSSKARIAILKNDLRSEGIQSELVEEIRSPIGLDIASETPEEIAVSIMAEIIKTKNQQKPSFGFPSEFLEEYDKHSDFAAALCTIISRKGSAPREVGSKMIVLENGAVINTIGGGCVETEVRNLALDVIASQVSQKTTCNMTKQQAEDEGMVCGGIIEVLIQPI